MITKIYTYNDKVAKTQSGKWICNYNIPAMTVRCKVASSSILPVENSGGTWTKVDNANNIWDWYRSDPNWQLYDGTYNRTIQFANNAAFDVIAMNLSGVTAASNLFATSTVTSSVGPSNVYNVHGTTSALSNISNMFLGCDRLQYVDLTRVSFNQVTNTSGMFYNCSNLQSIDSNNNEMVLSGTTTDVSLMFFGCTHLLEVPRVKTQGLSLLYMQGMFHHCNLLTSIDLSGITYTQNVVDMSGMFADCTAIEEIPHIQSTSSVTNMAGMFSYCTSCRSFPSLYTGKVTNMNLMFEYTRLGSNAASFPSMDTSKVTTMYGMFRGVTNFGTSNTIPSYNTVNVTNFSHMFEDSWLVHIPNLTYTNGKVADVRGMFKNAKYVEGDQYETYLKLKDLRPLITNSSMYSQCFYNCGSYKPGSSTLDQVPSGWK